MNEDITKRSSDHEERVKRHFDVVAEEFDNIYENRGDLVTRTINRLFRKAMYERIPISIRESRPLRNKTVLDIGCGSGRVSFLVAREAERVTGIDYARSMIQLAITYQQRLNMGSNTEFICCDFMKDFPESTKYDVSLALGVFDYIENPLPYLKKMKRITTTKIIASYPAKFSLQAPIRKVWLRRRNCPVFFYTREELERYYLEIGAKNLKIIPVPEGLILPDGFIVVLDV